MQTKTTNTVVALDGFLLVASPAGKNQFHLLILNQITGKCDSIILDDEVPPNQAKLRDEICTMIAVANTFGFGTFQQYQAICAADGEELPLNEALEEYNQISEKSRFLLSNIGSMSALEDFAYVLQ